MREWVWLRWRKLPIYYERDLLRVGGEGARPGEGDRATVREYGRGCVAAHAHTHTYIYKPNK